MDIVKVNDKANSNVIENDYLLEEMSDLDIENEINETAKKSVSELSAREVNWKNEQKKLKHQNDDKKSEKAKGIRAYQNRVLANCKTCGWSLCHRKRP